MSFVQKQNLWYHLHKYYQISGWTGAVNVQYRYMKKWRASHLEYNPRFHTNCKHVHSCPDSCHINQFHTSTHVFESGTELRSSWHICSEPSSNTPARQMVHVHQKPVSQAEQISCDKPQTFLNKSKDLDWPCASLQTAWCLNLRSMRKLEIFSFLHWNKSLL